MREEVRRTFEGCPPGVEGVAHDVGDDRARFPGVAGALHDDRPQVIEDGRDADGRNGRRQEVGAVGATELACGEGQEAPVVPGPPLSAGQALRVPGEGTVEGRDDLLVEGVELAAERAQGAVLAAFQRVGHGTMLAPPASTDGSRNGRGCVGDT